MWSWWIGDVSVLLMASLVRGLLFSWGRKREPGLEISGILVIAGEDEVEMKSWLIAMGKRKERGCFVLGRSGSLT